jgi:alpha-L-rhamnosidase
MAWDHWLRYADRDLLHRFWPAFEAWMGHIERANPDFVRRNAIYNNYGDWLSIGPSTDRTLVATAYWFRVADLMGRIATVLGKDAGRYEALAAKVKTAFADAFVGTDGRLAGDTQSAYLLALDFGLLDDAAMHSAAERLVTLIDEADGHLQTGFLGVRHICPVLTAIGRDDLAVDLLLKETYPSWGFSIRQGATTIWERWDGWTPEGGFQSANMNSFNHYAYGSVGEWIWSRIAGIDSCEEEPGYRKVRFAPCFDRRIGSCAATYRSHAGTVESAWHFEGDDVRWTIAIPPNSTGKVVLPSAWTSEDAPPDGVVGPGRHSFVVRRQDNR